MKLIQCRFSSGQRVPLLVQAGNAAPLPKLIPFIYVQLKLRHRAYNTAAAHLRAIQAFFYSYAESRNLDIDEAIVACHFEAILALLDGYAIWLQSGRQADNLVARIGTAAMAYFPQIDSRTRDLSTLERGLKSTTLDKLDEIAKALDVHPVSLLLHTYALHRSDQSIDQILCRVRKELSELS